MLPFLQIDLVIAILRGQSIDVQLPQAIGGFAEILQLCWCRLEPRVGFAHRGTDLGCRGAEHGLYFLNVRRRLADALVFDELPTDGSKAIHAEGKHDFVGLFAQQALGLGGLVTQDVGDDGGRRMEDGRWLVPHVVPASPPVAVRVHPPPVDDDDDDGADDDGGVGNESGRSNGPLARHRGAIDQQRRAAVEVRAVPPEPAPADGVDGNRSNDDLPLNQYAVVGGADRRVPRNNNFDPDEIIADIDRQDGAAAAAVVVGDDRVVGAGDDDEPQVEVYILPEDRIRYHLSMRSGVISSLPVGHEFHETHSLFTVVRTPNGAITPEDRVLIWASREEVQQLEEQRARKRARIE